MAGVEEGAVFDALDGGLRARLLGGNDLDTERVGRDAANVVAILSGDHNLSLLVEDHYHGDHLLNGLFSRRRRLTNIKVDDEK
jgi:hypothetical protein